MLRDLVTHRVHFQGLPAGEPEETFANILRGLFDATRVDEFSVAANQYLFDLAQHIFSSELSKDLPDTSALAKQVLPLSSALLDGIIENLCSVEDHDLPKAAAQTQRIVEDLLASRTAGPTSKADAHAVLLKQMAVRLCCLGYEASWQRKTGAALGLSILTSKVDLGVRWTADNGIEMIRALLFSLKDMPGDAPLNADMVADTLLHIVRACSTPGVRDDSPHSKTQINYIVGLLLIELCSQVASVRETVKKALQIFSDSTGTPLTELLLPVRDRLITPIFTKPLRALGFTMQIGHIDAVTYCISLQPPLIEFDDQLSRLLHEALGIADAEDTALMGSKTTAKTSAPLTQLRVVCVQLLSAALASPEFLQPKHTPTRLKALSVFFKLLYAKAPEVVEASYQSLKQVMVAQGKLPKDLLQNGLKPVLINLADHKKLSVASLQGLARLLELLTNYFKVEIGQKLVEHFRNLAVPADITRAATKQPSEDGELEIMAAIINIFHLLPHPAAECFLDPVIKLVVDVERHLKKIKTTIFTAPLAKYLQLYPVEATTFFFGRLTDERYVQTFRSVLASEHAPAIRAHITTSASELFSPCFASDGDLGYHAALVINQLIAMQSDWIVQCPDVLAQLIQRWVSDIRRQRLSAEGDLHFQQLREDALVIDIFVSYLKQAEHVDLLFHVVDVFTFSNTANHVALSRFLTRHVALSTDVPFKRRVLERFLDIFENTAVTKAHKTAVLRTLINPILLIGFSRGQREAGLIDVEYMNKIHQKIWTSPLLLGVVPAVTSFDDESMRIELLHMSAMMTKGCPKAALGNKAVIIKFGWVNIAVEDIHVKASAHVLVATFLVRNDPPTSRIIDQIYCQLVKAIQPESKTLVREALDILAPSLPKRGPSDSGVPKWAAWTKRILVEEGSSSMPLLVSIYQLMVRHSDLFFATRELYIPHVISSLVKLTLSATVTPDTRVLTLDVIELIMKWERKRIEMAKQDEAKMDVDSLAIAEGEVERSPRRPRPDRATSVAPSATSTGHGGSYVVPRPLRDQVVNNLLRFIANSAEAPMRNNLVARALALLKELIGPSVWSDFDVKLTFFHRTFTQSAITSETLVMVCNTAEVLSVVASHKTSDWILANIAALQMIIEKAFGTTELRIHSALRPVLERIFDVLPPTISPDSTDASPEAKAFAEWATGTINEGLRSMINLPATMMILQAWAKATPARVDAFIMLLIRVFSRYTKDHITSTTPVSSGDPQLRLLVSSLEVLRQRVSFLGEQRRWFLSGIVQLVEKSSNLDVCRFLLQMTRKWVTDKDEAYPTNKEKAGILLKMMSFETRSSESLQKDFLTLILDIYTDPTLARSELTVKLEPAFLLGCKIRDPVIRSKFIAVFDKSLATDLFSRLHFVLGVQSWESLGETYWIHQALDLVLGSVDPQDPLFLCAPATTSSSPSAFVEELETYTMGDLLGAARKLLYADPAATHAVWISTYKAVWTCLTRREQLDLTRFMIGLLTKEYHLRSVDRRPNVVQTLLAGALECSPTPSLPPHLVRYLGKTFNAWHTGIELLQEALENPREDEAIRESTLDALAETYSELSEDDLLYGLWRRRAGYNETNAAIR